MLNSHHLQHGLEQLRLDHRLGQITRDADFFAALEVVAVIGRGEDDQLGLLVGESIANPSRQFKAIHLGHHAIENRQRKGLSVPLGARQSLAKRRLTAVGHFRIKLPSGQVSP